jgi:hypothetical protein
MSIRKNDKQKPLGIVGAIPEFIGVMAGISMVTGKWIGRNVRSLLGGKPIQPKQVAKRPVQLEAEMRIDAIRKKMASQKQAKATVPKKPTPPTPVKAVKTKKKTKKKTTKTTTKKNTSKGVKRK